MTEAEFAKGVIAWLTELQWDIYQEVAHLEWVADIVAVQSGRVWVIEVKKALSLDVHAQADRWKPYAHWRSIATPRTSTFSRKICRTFGIGQIEISKRGDCIEHVAPALNRKAKASQLLLKLQAEHKTYAEAGTNSGRHWSPFKATCRDILEYVTKHPGCNIKEVVTGVQTHYASSGTARACIAHWAQAGKIPGIRVERKGKALHFFREDPV